MELLEVSEKRKMTREDAAKLLNKIADQLSRHNKLEFVREGKSLRIDVADQVEVELELELETGESSLEIEIKW